MEKVKKKLSPWAVTVKSLHDALRSLKSQQVRVSKQLYSTEQLSETVSILCDRLRSYTNSVVELHRLLVESRDSARLYRNAARDDIAGINARMRQNTDAINGMSTTIKGLVDAIGVMSKGVIELQKTLAQAQLYPASRLDVNQLPAGVELNIKTRN